MKCQEQQYFTQHKALSEKDFYTLIGLKLIQMYLNLEYFISTQRNRFYQRSKSKIQSLGKFANEDPNSDAPFQPKLLMLKSCSSTFLDLDVRNLDQTLEQLEKDNNLSHYESQLANLQSEKFIEENISKFLNRCSNSSNTTNLDQRILFSLKKCYLN
ncbi:hypothetical protein ABPG73_008960 [Tetrahymena malaccensis]